MSETNKKIDNDFFINYAGTGKHYNEVWRNYTGFDVFNEYMRDFPQFNSCLVLGSATGKILEALYKECALEPFGIEINEYAYQHELNADYPVFCGDMREMIKSMPYGFNVIYSNSLMYLPEEDIVSFLEDCGKVSNYFFWYGSMEGWSIPDEYRTTLRSYEWWNEQFEKAGYKLTEHRHLWRKK